MNTFVVGIKVEDEGLLMGDAHIKTIVKGKKELQKLITTLPEDHIVMEIQNFGFVVDSKELFEEWAKLNKPEDLELG